jgi:hypothetical protein
LAYPVMSLAKDLVILDKAMDMNPDLIIWPVTLQSFARNRQLDHPLLQNNPELVRGLIGEYSLDLEAADKRFVEPSFFDETIVGRRRDLADLLRLQLYGFSWAATGVDQYIPEEIDLRSSDLEADAGWLDIESEMPLTSDQLAWEVLEAGSSLAGDTPLLIINEPIYISQGENSDLRYNAWYPRWAYDQYRQLLGNTAEEEGWLYLDLWDRIDPDQFTDSPVHLTPLGSAQLTKIILDELLVQADLETGS